MIKKSAYLLILAGFVLVAIGAFELLQTSQAHKDSLNEVYNVLATPIEEVNDKGATSFHPHQGETVGLLEIPKIEGKLPIIEGTNENELARGVGHFKESAYPKQMNQIVLSGHRDTVFRRMGELKVGDELFIEVPYGRFRYEIVSTKIVRADDRTIIQNTFPKEELIVSTCYPFSYIGVAPERYIITAYPIDRIEELNSIN